jgi:hypothetical protein
VPVTRKENPRFSQNSRFVLRHLPGGKERDILVVGTDSHVDAPYGGSVRQGYILDRRDNRLRLTLARHESYEV